MQPDNAVLNPVTPITNEEFEERIKHDLPLSNAQACYVLGLHYTPDAMAQLARRCPDLPRPYERGPGGGHYWFRDELEAWLRSQNRSTARRWQARGLK